MRVIAVAAVTADGRIGRHPLDPPTWTSHEDKRMFAAVSRQAGVVVMGRATFEAMPKPLEGRLNVVLTAHPAAFAPVPGRVEYTADPPAAVLDGLARRGYAEVIVGGGASVYRQFFAAGLVDELWLTVEPLLFGAGISLLGDESAEVRLRLIEHSALAPSTIQLKYAVERS
jgi:dihydrofolate reductase